MSSNTVMINGVKALTPENFVEKHMNDVGDVRYEWNQFEDKYEITGIIAPNQQEFTRSALKFLFGNTFIRECDQELTKFLSNDALYSIKGEGDDTDGR